MSSCLYDNIKTSQRELWVLIEGKPVQFGWCAAYLLGKATLAPYWHGEEPFGGYDSLHLS